MSALTISPEEEKRVKGLGFFEQQRNRQFFSKSINSQW